MYNFTTIFEVDKYYSNIPIGKALDNFKLYIADKFGHLLPYGACGELMISGWQVSRGYLNKPEKTSEVYTKIFMTMQKAMKSCIIPVMLPDIFRMETSDHWKKRLPG